MEQHELYKKMCEMLSDYNVMVARIKNIDLDLSRMPKLDTEEDAIEGLYYSKVKEGGPPAPGSVSDRTSSVAIKWMNELIKVNRDLGIHRRSLEFEKLQLTRIVNKNRKCYHKPRALTERNSSDVLH